MKSRVLMLVSLWLTASVLFAACSAKAENPNLSLDPMGSDASDFYSSGYENITEELCGVYIATAYNIDFPSRVGLDAKTLAAELDEIVETIASVGANAIYFQVRPNSDALYASTLFPVSSYLTGKVEGELPDGFDPLEYLVNAAHEKGIEVHAWVNPLRVTRGSVSNPQTDVEALAENHPARLNPELVIEYAGELYYDPGLPEVRALVAAGVAEIVNGYDVDGVLFDDYFYPYPETGSDGETLEFDDSASFTAYGGDCSLDDWRRSNINSLIEACYDAIKAEEPNCRFGVAPFGIWQNNDGANGGSDTLGMEAYSAIYCDALAWAEGGYVDYLAPQIYWSFSQYNARYDVIADFWNSRLDGTGVELYISHAVYRYGTDSWSEAGVVDEITAQISYARRLLTYKGSLLYGYDELRDNIDGVSDELALVYADEVLYADPIGTGGSVAVVNPEYGSATSDSKISLYCVSDPTIPVTYNGNKISRLKDGSFVLDVTLKSGKNYFAFYTKYGKYEFMIEKGGET